MRALVFLSLAAAVLAPAGVAQQFTMSTIAGTNGIWSDGVEIADIDGDGDLDVMFANGSSYGGSGTQGAQPQHLFLNNGAGVLTAAHGQLNVSNFNAKMVIAEDFDNDGDLDLAYCSGSAGFTPRLLINDGTGNFTDESAVRLPALSLRSFSLVAGDYDDDGDLDIAISDGGTFFGVVSQARLLQNDGAGVFTDVTATDMPADLYNCQDITFVDFDGDFDVDMLLSGKGGGGGPRGRLYINDNGTFVVDSAMNLVGTGSTYECDWSDFDGDGDFDTSVQSISGVQEGWARNDGAGVAMPEFVYPSPNGGDDNEMAQMDYDNDGDADAFAGSLGGTEKVWRNDGGGVFVNQNTAIQSQSDATLDMGFGDLDGDCRIDFVTAQGESGNFTNRVYTNNGPQDTLPPVLMALEATVVTTPETVVHAQFSDSIADDGHIGVTVTYTWSTDDGGNGAGVAINQGGGLYRAAVPTTGATTAVDITWTATDHCGNTTVVGGGSPFTDLGCADAGVSGDPVLTGTGALTAGSGGSLDLTNAAPSAPAALFVAIGPGGAGVPFKGGTLKAVPVLLTASISTNGLGELSLPFVTPGGVSGVSVVVQWGISDNAATANTSLSNALQLDFQ